ncbi:MAG: ShlB/FhaC/HecB family hemolysin secretion/activation protein [Pseudolabrys sp.]|nr:ShlB/FhaC/HecB family hemolysin secretion/activation protein [Pseudolabrys sp.]
MQAPPGSEKLSYVVGRVIIEGAFGELANQTRPLVAAIEGQRVTVAQIYDFANALEEIYARAGYVLVRVTVPPQSLRDNGVLRIAVTDGFIEDVQVDRVPAQARALVAARSRMLIGRGHITLAQLERVLLTAGDIPGLRLKSTLARGSSPGGSLLVLDGEHRLVTGTANVGNQLPASLGTWSYGGSLAINTPFGYGEQFYGSAQTAGDTSKVFQPDSPLRTLGAGIVVPLGLDGWTLNPEYTYSRSVPIPVSGGVDSIGYFQRFALRTNYSIIRTRSETLSINGGYEHISQEVALPQFDTDLNRDKYSVLRGGIGYETALPFAGAGIQASATFSRGLGGRDQNDALQSGIPLSRQGAGPVFNKLSADLRYSQPLFESVRLDVTGRMQTSFRRPVLASEQFALDGQQAISAFANGTFNVDEGATVRGELSRPFNVPGAGIPLVLSPYGFAAYGAGRLNNATILEVASMRASAFGVGLRSSIDLPGGYTALILGIEAARQYSNLPNYPHGWRTNVNISLRF